MDPIRPELEEALRDRYILEHELGRGGMARVYLARDLKHDRLVALKVLHPELAATLGPQRFLREIKLAAQLQHPHILPVYDSGEAAGHLWFTMPYIQGETVRQRLQREGRLSLEEAGRITAETARALDYAHRQGIIHRDIKPENILLNGEGDALVADFGIGRSVAADPAADHLTETGLLLGTPAYMSPEQAAGQRELDARSDIYSLGVVLFELLTGEPPFTGPNSYAVMAQRFSGEIPRVRLKRPSVPDAVDQVLAKAMGQTPDQRFQTAGQFASAVGTHFSVSSVAASTLATAQPKVGVGRLRVRIMAAVLLAGFAGVLAWIAGRSAKANDGPKRLVVLPFENLGKPEQEYFADGLTDDIAAQLGSVAGLAVISRRSAMNYKGSRKSLKQIGSELGVAYALGGTVKWEPMEAGGGRVRATPELIQVRDDRQIWSRTFDVNLSDVFGVERQIAQEVIRSLGGTERPQARADSTSNPAAYDAYLRGNAAFFQMASTGGNIGTGETAIAAYREAVRLDPRLALAWARLAQAIVTMLNGASTSPEADPRRAKEAAQQAAALAPDLAEAQLAMAAVSSGQTSKRALKRAYALAPDDPQVLHVLARRTMEAGPHEYDVLVNQTIDTTDSLWRCRAALDLLQHAQALDPKSIPILRGLSSAYSCLGRQDQAEQALDRAIEVAPDLVEQWQLKSELALDQGGLAAARSELQQAKRYVARDALVSYMAVFNDEYWVLDEVDQQFLLRLGPQSFSNDTLGWALALAHTAALRRDSATARAYADTALQFLRPRRNPALAVYEMVALGYLGRGKEARSLIRVVSPDELPETPQGWAYTQLQVIRTYNLLGDRDAAMRRFQYLVTRSEETLPLKARWRLDPVTAPLNGDPRFEALFRK